MDSHTITFNVNKKTHSFTVLNNLSEYGLSIEAAFINWAARTDTPTSIAAFCKYVISKDPINLRCKPQKAKLKK